MKTVLVVGAGISGLSCAIELAQGGCKVILASPMPSERAQSVMAAGGINASKELGEDTVQSHVEDTLNGGRNIAGAATVGGLCADAPDILRWLESLGMVFNRDTEGNIDRRAFGGQRYKRTAFAGACTGKQIVTALIQKAREYEKAGLIQRRLGYDFHSGLISGNRCFGALFYSERENALVPVFADETVMAVGGQNRLFGKTTGSMLCDGYAAAKLFMQGAALKNLEFIQYHPTTIETPQKRMLITEAARGEGGRLYYDDGGKRIYFMEDKFGPNGNLMPRDVVSKCIYDTGRQVYLDISFLGKQKISERLQEVDELCTRYLGIDVSKESIPVAPSVHFFMGGIAVDGRHRSSIDGLYAVGECASIYHGANRLGGNSLLAAVRSGRVAAGDILTSSADETPEPDFTAYIDSCIAELSASQQSGSTLPPDSLLRGVEEIMHGDMGITRDETRLRRGIEGLDCLIVESRDKVPSCDLLPYYAFRARPMMVLARAILTCAEARRETRGAHIRDDYPEMSAEFEKCTLIRYNEGNYDISYESEDAICW